MASEVENELRGELVIIEQSAPVKITDQTSYDNAVELLTGQVIPFRKRWKDYWESLIKAAHNAHKAVLGKFKEGDEPAERLEKALKDSIRNWDEEQGRIRREAQHRAQQEAIRRAEAEHMAEAVFSEQDGASPEEIEAIFNEPMIAPPVEPTYVRNTAVSVRDNYKARVVDMKALCRAIAAGKVPVNYVLPNEPVLNARAKADRESLDIPGVKVWNDRGVSARSNG